MKTKLLLNFVALVLTCTFGFAQAPANDDCSSAITLTVSGTSSCGGTTTGTTINATQSIAPISCNGYGVPASCNDVWYSFVATSTMHDISVASAAGYQVITDLRSGACNGTNINCAVAANSGGTATINASGLIINNMYFLRVYYYSGTNTFTICVTTPSPPTNDDCLGAIALTVSNNATCTAAVKGSVKHASQSIAPLNCHGGSASSANDVWYSFVATAKEHNIIVGGSSTSDLILADLDRVLVMEQISIVIWLQVVRQIPL